MAKKQGLGKGVDILFGEEDDDVKETFFYCLIKKINTNKEQPRTRFDDNELNELADSIKENGIIQPLIVSEGEKEGEYNLIAGERRLRASKLAGLKEVPVIVSELASDSSVLELALIENIQRTDLSPIEEAIAYKKLIEKFKYTQEEVSKKVGKQRSTITNSLRLLKLPEDVQNDIISGQLSEGHGRVLLKLIDTPLVLNDLKNQIIKEELSVRQTEEAVRKFEAQKKNPEKKENIVKNALTTVYVKKVTGALGKKLNSKIVINQKGNKGKIEIEYNSPDELERITNLLLDKQLEK